MSKQTPGQKPIIGTPAPVISVKVRDPLDDPTVNVDEPRLAEAEEIHSEPVYLIRPAEQYEIDEMTTTSKDEHDRVVEMLPDSTVGIMVARVDKYLHLRCLVEIPKKEPEDKGPMLLSAEGKRVDGSVFLHHLIVHYFEGVKNFHNFVENVRNLQEADANG